MPTATSNALRPYSGSFGPAEARHLLRRATVGGCTQANVEEAVELGLAATVDRLLVPKQPGRPVTTIDNHPTLNLGDVWIDTPRVDGFDENWRNGSVREWVLGEIVTSGFSASGRMWLFWINHFGAVWDSGRRGYDYQRKLYDHVFGDFSSLVKEITIDAEMLRFLNGKSNQAKAPNENYARELLELFTVGKADALSPEGFVPYTEDDVREIARALTGWTLTYDQYPQVSIYKEGRHDTGDKQLSASFGNAVLTDAGADEYKQVVDVILAQPRALHYLCRKLYRWLVDYAVDATVEEQVVGPLADVMRATGFDVGQTLRTLLLSETFFDTAHRGALPKSPLDHIVEVYLGFGAGLPPKSETKRRSRAISNFHWRLRDQGLSIHEPDSVAGFVPWHQEPHFNRGWVNPTNLLNRSQVLDQASGYGIDLKDGTKLMVDLLAYVDTFDNPYDPNDLLAELAERHLAVPIPYDQIRTLKEYLIPDLPDWEWTVEYGLYRDNPNDEGQRKAVAKRVEAAWKALLGSAEFAMY